MVAARQGEKMKTIFTLLVGFIIFLTALPRMVLADTTYGTVESRFFTGTVSEIRYGPYRSGNVIWVRLDGGATGCNAALDGGASEAADFVSMPLDRLGSDSKKIYLSQLMTAKSLGRSVQVEYNGAEGASCEILFLELK